MATVDTKEQITKRLAANESSPKQVDLLTKILRATENDPNLWVADCNITDAVGNCENHMSTVQRANVTARRSNGSYLQKSFVMKVQIQDETKMAALKSNEVWAVEEFIYKSILPALTKLTKTQLPHPEYYYSDSNFIILEDLSEFGYKMGERLDGLDFEHTMLVMEAFADLHSASLAMQYKDADKYKVYKKTFHHPYDSVEQMIAIEPYIKKVFLHAVEIIKSENRGEKYDKIVSYLLDVADNQEKYIQKLRPSREVDNLVFIHGDAWINNIMFKNDETTGKPKDVKFIDFQCTKFGSAAVDLFHLLYTSVEPKTRRNHYDKFVQHYHQRFSDQLTKFTDDVEYVNKYSFDRFLKEMEKYRVYGLLNAALVLPAICVPKNSNYDFLKFDSNNNTEMYTERLFDILDEYIENEWFEIAQ